MKRILKKCIPLLLILGILFSIGWYLFEYDNSFTRDMLLRQARRLEDSGRHTASVWLYKLAYRQSDKDDRVAIELAEQFKAIGNYTKAEYTLAKAIEDGGSVELYIALCKTYVEQDKLRDAVLLLDNVNNPEIRAELEALRPAAPNANIPSGQYAQYLHLELLSAQNLVYCSTDRDYPSVLTDSYTKPLSIGSGDTTVFALSVGENGLVSPLAIFNYHIDGVVEEVVFRDSVVEAALRQQLQVENSHTLYSNDLWFVTELTIPAGAASLEDLKWLPQLQKLTITGGHFQDLQPVAQLSQLEQLHITDSSLAHDSLRSLAGMAQLKQLTLSGCGISSIADLAEMNTLTYLDLSNNAIRNISALSGMMALEQLDLSGNALINIEAISQLQNLRVLDISYNSLVTTKPIASLTSLEQLDLSSNELRNLDGVEQLLNLQRFVAQYNQLLEVDALASCTALVYVDVSYNTLLNIDGVVDLTKLQTLVFAHNEVSNLPKFSKSCALQIIDGSYNTLKSLDRLSGLENLTHIYMDYNASLSSIDTLQHCPKLQEVNVYGTKVRNVSKLTSKGILVHYTPR